jgi:hypothetical protein
MYINECWKKTKKRMVICVSIYITKHAIKHMDELVKLMKSMLFKHANAYFQFTKHTILFAIVLVATTIMTVVFLTYHPLVTYSASSPWTQTDWSGGSSSGTVTSTVDTYSSITNIDATTTSGQFNLDITSGWASAYTSWGYRKTITFDNTSGNLGTTPENLVNFPVLIALDSGDIDYSKTQDNGEDIRFTDSDGTTTLSYEIEEWNESGTSYVWVKVPQIDTGNSDYIYMYYGNDSASDGQDVEGVWDDSFDSVWHLNEAPASATLEDSTSDNKDGTPTNTTVVDGLFGNSRRFTNGHYIRTTRNTGTTVTVSAWAKYTATSPLDMLFIFGTGNPGPDLFFYRGKISLNSWNGDGNPFCSIPASATDGGWHLYTTVIQPGSGNTKQYYDGILCGTANYVDPTDTTFGISSNGAGYDWEGGKVLVKTHD